MRNENTALALRRAAIGLFLATALAGCVSRAQFSAMTAGSLGTLTPRGSVELYKTPAVLVGAVEGGADGLLRMRDGGFVLYGAIGDSAYGLQRFDETLQPRWSAPVLRPDADSQFGVFMSSSGLPGLGSKPRAKEVVISVSRSDGTIAVLSYVHRQSDSLDVMGRLYDAATGRELGRRVISSTVLSDELGEEDQRAFVSFSPDSSRILAYTLVPGEDESQLAIHAQVLTSDLKVVRSASLTLEAVESRRLQSVEVDGDGNIFAIQRVLWHDVLVERHPTDGASTTMRVTLTDDVGSKKSLGNVIATVEENNTLLVSAPVLHDDDLIGIATARLNMLEREPTHKKTAMITEEMLEAQTGDDELEDARLHSVVRADGETPYVLVLESRTTEEVSGAVTDARTGTALGWQSRERRKSVYAVVGDILLVGCDTSGAVRWLGRVKRENRSPISPFLPASYNYRLMDFRTHITSDRWLQVMHVDREGLRVSDVRLDNGAGRTLGGNLLLESADGAVPYPRSTLWLSDHEAIFTGAPGPLYRMNYATR